MLNLPDPKVFWNDMAKDPESESPGVKDPDKLRRASLASRLGLSGFARPSDGHAEVEEKVVEEQEESEGNDGDSTFTGLLMTIKQNVSQPDDGNVPASNPSTIVQPIRPSALAARRHLQRPPRNVNIASHPSSSSTGTNDNTDDDTFPGPTPLPISTGVARP